MLPHSPCRVLAVMDFVFCCPNSSHVSVDTVHPSLLRSYSSSALRWYHPQNLSSYVFLVSSHHMCPNRLSLDFLHLSVTFSTFSLSLMVSVITWSRISITRRIHRVRDRMPIYISSALSLLLRNRTCATSRAAITCQLSDNIFFAATVSSSRLGPN